MGREAGHWPRLHAPGRHLFHASLAARGYGLWRLPAALTANVHKWTSLVWHLEHSFACNSMQSF